jgi:hypothetical protein
MRYWWCRLWVREDEFHPSLDLDSEVILSLPANGWKKYSIDLVKRRDKAHNRKGGMFSLKSKKIQESST